MAQRLGINPSKVVHETVDGETILIHLQTGNYYSLTGAAAEIWALVEAARSSDQIASELAERHDRPQTEVDAAVTLILRELTDEDLLEPAVNGVASNGSAPVPAWRADAWQPPKVEKFSDMQNFLLVDPIHEVDAAGWPSTKPE